MSTIEQVRAAERKVQEILAALERAGARDPDNLSEKLQAATDDYATLVGELSVGLG